MDFFTNNMRYLFIFFFVFLPVISVSASTETAIYWCGSGERFSTYDEAKVSLNDSYDRARKPLVDYLTELQGKYDGLSSEKNTISSDLNSAKKIAEFLFIVLIVSLISNWYLFARKT